MADQLYVGLMSGTSIDAVDAALARISDAEVHLLACHSEPLDDALRDRIRALCRGGGDEVERLGVLDRELGRLFAHAANTLLGQAGLGRKSIRAIGSHGQTIRHRPPSEGNAQSAFSWQIADPNTIAEHTGITTVADFRRRDIAAGGEGAPLAPAFHNAVFRSAERSRAIINIGGIANVTLLDDRPVRGFDTGPGSTLLDAWSMAQRQLPYDRHGAWAASGSVRRDVVDALLGHEYFRRRPPKSTGPELFNLGLLDHAELAGAPPEDIQASLAEVTARSIAASVASGVAEAYVCGGGAHNRHLMGRLRHHLDATALHTTEVLGVHPDWVEATAFAWLARQTLERQPGNLPAVTGAGGERVLGAVYPA